MKDTICLLLTVGIAVGISIPGLAAASAEGPIISDQNKAADAALLQKYARQIAPVQMSILNADRKGDFAQAVQFAKQGIAFGSYSTGFKVCGYCEYYYAKALISGLGTDKNEQQGFRLLQEMYDHDYHAAAALDLAELYAHGIGTKQDLVKAYEIVRENDDLICTNGCQDIYRRRAALKESLVQKLSAAQIDEADKHARTRNPYLSAHNMWRNAIGGGICIVLVSAALFYRFKLRRQT